MLPPIAPCPPGVASSVDVVPNVEIANAVLPPPEPVIRVLESEAQVRSELEHRLGISESFPSAEEPADPWTEPSASEVPSPPADLILDLPAPPSDSQPAPPRLDSFQEFFDREPVDQTPSLAAAAGSPSVSPTDDIVIPTARTPWAGIGLAAFAALGLLVTLVWVLLTSTGETGTGVAKAEAAPPHPSVSRSVGAPSPKKSVAPRPPKTSVASAAPVPAEPRTPAAATPAAKEQDPVTEADPQTPPGLDAAVADFRIELALRKARQCHRGGRATGTSRVIMTFDPKGTVQEARLEGEPIASAPVGTCILTIMSGVVLPKFEGDPVTIEREITLR